MMGDFSKAKKYSCLLMFALPAMLSNTATWAMPPGNRVIKECWDQNKSHIEEVECLAAIRNQLREDMKKAYDEAMAKARKQDSDMKRAGSKTLIKAEQLLASSQDAFEGFFTDECARQAYHAMGGTAGADYGLACEIGLLRYRIEQLSE